MKILRIILLALIMILTFNVTNSSDNGKEYNYIYDTSGRVHAIDLTEGVCDLPDSIVYELTGRKREYDLLVRMKGYIDKIGYLESRGNYSVTNQFGYMGKYQFGKNTLRGLGYTEQEIKGFIKNEDLQEQAMLRLTEHNLEVLNNYGLMKYVGSNVNGVYVTVEGMLAGSHLLGPHAVRQFIKHGKIGADGNGTTIVKYMKQFA